MTTIDKFWKLYDSTNMAYFKSHTIAYDRPVSHKARTHALVVCEVLSECARLLCRAYYGVKHGDNPEYTVKYYRSILDKYMSHERFNLLVMKTPGSRRRTLTRLALYNTIDRKLQDLL